MTRVFEGVFEGPAGFGRPDRTIFRKRTLLKAGCRAEQPCAEEVGGGGFNLGAGCGRDDGPPMGVRDHCLVQAAVGRDRVEDLQVLPAEQQKPLLGPRVLDGQPVGLPPPLPVRGDGQMVWQLCEVVDRVVRVVSVSVDQGPGPLVQALVQGLGPVAVRAVDDGLPVEPPVVVCGWTVKRGGSVRVHRASATVGAGCAGCGGGATLRSA